MICEICDKDFTLNGSVGGNKRLSCFKCIPSELTCNERKRVRYKLLSEKSNLLKIKMGCKHCGYNKNSTALEWHHTDDNKENNPSLFIRSGGWNKYLREIDKCILLCSNCHREEHNPSKSIEELLKGEINE